MTSPHRRDETVEVTALQRLSSVVPWWAFRDLDPEGLGVVCWTNNRGAYEVQVVDPRTIIVKWLDADDSYHETFDAAQPEGLLSYLTEISAIDYDPPAATDRRGKLRNEGRGA